MKQTTSILNSHKFYSIYEKMLWLRKSKRKMKCMSC